MDLPTGVNSANHMGIAVTGEVDAPNPTGGMSDATIGGIVAAVLVLGGIVTAAVVYYKKRQMRQGAHASVPLHEMAEPVYAS